MGVLIKPSDYTFVSILTLESGNQRMWVDKSFNALFHRIPM